MSERTSQIGQPATPLSRTLASIHSWQGAPGMNPREILHTLDRLIAERLWEGEVGWDGEPMTLARALTEPWPVGLGMTDQRLERLYALAQDADVDPDLVRRVREAVDRILPKVWRDWRQHRPDADKSGAGGKSRRRRTFVAAFIANAETCTSDVAGEITPTWRSSRRESASQTAIRIDSPENAVRALLRVFTADELRRALDEAADSRGDADTLSTRKRPRTAERPGA